ncbi:hypothetical protein NC651_034779 [Populus alba x Populus x berolinensis]|nr:hypothetical protein NC651_034779 [Populus alba x Populus x berolinensis]
MSFQDPFFIYRLLSYEKLSALPLFGNQLSGTVPEGLAKLSLYEVHLSENNFSSPVPEAWIAEMAAYIKSMDKRHLVTVGLQGFYGLNTTNKSEVNLGFGQHHLDQTSYQTQQYPTSILHQFTHIQTAG